MLYRLVRPMRRKGSRHPYFLQRIPVDVKALAVGLKLALPIGAETVSLIISAKAETVKVSLRTARPRRGEGSTGGAGLVSGNRMAGLAQWRSASPLTPSSYRAGG